MHSIERLASGVYLEGLAIDHQRGAVWYSDVVAGGVHGLMEDGTARVLNPQRRFTGGILLNDDGAVLSSGGGGIMWNHPDSGQSGWLLDRIDGAPISGVNEMCPDGNGGIFFGSCDIERIAAGETPRPSAIYRLTVDGEVLLVADDIGFCNGIALSDDGAHLFCNNTFACTYLFDVAPDLTLCNRRVLLEKEDCDGLALDADGNAWITGFSSGHIERVALDGMKLPCIDTPERAITQVRFGGEDGRDLYFTAVPADGGENLKKGAPLQGERSHLYRARSAVAGVLVAPTRFALG